MKAPPGKKKDARLAKKTLASRSHAQTIVPPNAKPDAALKLPESRPSWKDHCVQRFKEVEEVMAAFDGAVFAMAKFAVGLSILWTILSRH